MMHAWHICAILTADCSRLEAFHAHGVDLKHAWRSWSGVRRVDGVVLFAIPESDVHADDAGSRCLLWSQEAEARFGLQASDERLVHCRFAAWQGSAEGLLVRSYGQVNSRETFEFRVERRAEQYWGFWGSAAQTRRVREKAADVRLASGAATR